MTAEQPRRDAHRECPVSSCCAPWTGQCLVAVRWWSSPASRPRNGGVGCPVGTRRPKFARGRFARGERAGKRTPGARSRRRTAWRRVVPRTGRVGEKRGSDCGSRHGVRSVDDDFFSFLLDDCFPRFRDAAGDGTDERKRPARTSVSDFRCQIGRSRCKSRRARASSRCLIRARSPSDTRGARAPRPAVSRDGRRDARVGRRDAPRLDRRGDDVAIRHLRDRGEARGRATRRVAAQALELRTRLERAERRNADLERSRGEGEGEGDPAGTERSPVGTTERDTANDIERRLMTKERGALRTTRTTRTKSATRDVTSNAERSPKRSPKHAPAHLGWRARAARSRTCARERRAARVRAVGDDERRILIDERSV